MPDRSYMPNNLDEVVNLWRNNLKEWEWEKFGGEWRARKRKVCGCCYTKYIEITETDNEIMDRMLLYYECIKYDKAEHQ